MLILYVNPRDEAVNKCNSVNISYKITIFLKKILSSYLTLKDKLIYLINLFTGSKPEKME